MNRRRYVSWEIVGTEDGCYDVVRYESAHPTVVATGLPGFSEAYECYQQNQALTLCDSDVIESAPVHAVAPGRRSARP